MIILEEKKGTPDKVKAYFGQSHLYLDNNYNIRFRQEIVNGFLGTAPFSSILDIACGNAAISLPFLRETNRLTLLDSSSGMLAAASQNIPEGLRTRVELLQNDFLDADLPAGSFDLIICTGLLAHLPDPVAALKKIVLLLAPQGTIILQNTNAAHFYTLLNNMYRFIGTLINRSKYQYNHLRERTIREIFGQDNIRLIDRYCYIQSFMLLDRLLKPETKYVLTKKLFGSCRNNSLSLLGNDCIYRFRHTETLKETS